MGLGDTNPVTGAEIEEMAERKIKQLHNVDSLSLMLYVFLLIITVLTIWLFKHRRLRFIHETGLTMIYGLIVGLIIKYCLKKSGTIHPPMVVVPRDVSFDNRTGGPPDILQLDFNSVRAGVINMSFNYKFDGESNPNSEVEQQATFNPEIFFDILLPPIIFNAGYSLKRRNFFRNIGSILSFALFGATVSCLVVGFIMYGLSVAFSWGFALTQCLFFGALISSTDPVTVLAIFSDLSVDVDLFALVFGESALNDAVALVLSNTIEAYVPSNPDYAGKFDGRGFAQSVGSFFAIFLGSVGLGSLTGCIAALITKFTKISEFPTLETALFILMSYSSFLMSEAAGMTGIVSVLFCGICQAHYTYNNLSEESQQRTKQFFDMLNFLLESFIFTYIGVSMFTSEAHSFNWGFIAGSFMAIAVGRAIFVYPFAALINLARRPRIPMHHQHMIFFAGLRGAIAFALAIRNTASKERQQIYTTTSLIVILTVIVNGGLTAQMIKWLGIKHGSTNETEIQSELRETRPPADERSPVVTPNGSRYNPWDKAFLPRKWYNFDSRFMKPLLTHSRPNLIETMPHCFLPIARILTTTQQMSTQQVNGSHAGGDEDWMVEPHSDENEAGTPSGSIFEDLSRPSPVIPNAHMI